MSVAEFAGHRPSDADEALGASAYGARTPPQDNAAEQCVLGAMMLSKDAIADVVESLRGTDFYRPVHESVFDAVVDLYGRGEPADAVTVAAELQKRGELARVGGAPYLHTLVASVPVAANAGYYAEIVREKAILRRLVDAGTKIVQIGYAGEGEVDDVVDQAQAEVYGVTDKRTSEDYAPLSEIMEATLDELDAISSRGGAMSGVPTGFADLDELTNGLHPGQMVIIAARPAIGKALALDTPLATPDGWTTMGQVRVGDHLIGADGRPVRVVSATEVMNDRACYEVFFADGGSIIADAQHQWATNIGALRAAIHTEIKTTEEIARTLRCASADKRLNHAVRTCDPVQLPDAQLDLPPYVLGVWLGNGRSTAALFTSADAEIPMRVEGEGILAASRGSSLYSLALPRLRVEPRDCLVCGRSFVPQTSQVRTCGLSCGRKLRLVAPPAGDPRCADCGRRSNGFRCHACHRDHGTVTGLLRRLGVLNDKHIPATYLRSSERQRRELLAGLMDTHGTVTDMGGCQITLTNKRLISDVQELIVSLGYRCQMTTKKIPGSSDLTSTAFTLNFTSPDDVFWLTRKATRHKELRPGAHGTTGQRMITDVRRVPSVAVRCVQVDAADNLYLAGQAMVPTHNSMISLDFARSASIRHGLASVIFSLEMGRTEITMRLLSAEARIPLNSMRNGKMTDDDWSRLARRMGEVSSAPLFIDDSPNMTMMEIRAKARRLKQRHDLRLLIVDYLQLMQSGKKVESRQLEVSEFSRQLKLLAKELDVPVVAVSQLNRGPEQRTDKRPMLSDLRESGCLTADTTLLRADTGAPVTLEALLRDEHHDIAVWSLDEHRRMVPAPITAVFPSGVKEVFRLVLASGRTVKASANHRFLTLDGWRALGDLTAADRIAVPRRIPAPLAAGLGWSHHRIRLLAHLIGDRCVLDRLTHGVRNQVNQWFRDLGIAGLQSHEMRLPDALYAASDDEVLVFLRHLWTSGGCGFVPGPEAAKPNPSVYYATASRALADGVVHLLGRLGISARLAIVPQRDPSRPQHHVTIAGVREARRFSAAIGVHEARGSAATAFSNQTHGEADDPDPLCALANDDVLWDPVVSVTSLGRVRVYDATVKGTHNFVADGIVAHNSIEQDSDMVVLLHREDAYDRESTRPGEADLIVAKHRNGPTATITVAFQGHYSRFVDMAPG